MSSKNITLIIVVLFILLLGGCGCSNYNGLVSSNQNVLTAWSNVETNYQRRTDLYSSVVKEISASANFEKSTLTQVIEARSNATKIQVNVDDSASLAAYQRAQGQLQGSFSRLMAVAEAYPNLKTTQSFQDFQAQIEGTENRINTARRDFNDAVNSYNLRVKRFPGNIFSGIFGFHEKPYYKADPGSDKNPDQDYNIK